MKIVKLSPWIITYFLFCALAAGEKLPRHEDLLGIESLIREEITKKTIPGCILHIEKEGFPPYTKAFGNRTLVPQKEKTTLDTIYDTASLTKILVTAPAVLQLAEQGKLDLGDPVAKHIQGFSEEGRAGIELHHLLAHTSGLPPGIPLDPHWQGTAKAIELACQQPPRHKPGEKFIYSDINYILLGEIVARVSGQGLQEYSMQKVFRPLGMLETTYLPGKGLLPRIAPTDHTGEGKSLVHGVVHDPTARRMGGVAGHAGVFTTARDLARFARMLLNGGELGGKRILTKKSVRLLTTNQLPKDFGNQRGYGMDIHTGYSSPRGNLFPVGSYGHTGFTGPTLWIDPHSRSFYILLTNRNHPHTKASVVHLRRKLGTLAAQATHPYTPKVLNGIDVLVRQNFKPLHNLRTGLITNHTGRDARSILTADLLHESRNVNLRALFSPEHGIRGKLDQAKINDSTDLVTGLPIYSLYGKTRKPTPEQLEGIDILVFDIQDIGARYYTYLSTMGLCMEAAAENGIQFLVLDRVNPINGKDVNGLPLTTAETFVRYHDIPIRHGMTAGELARMFNSEKKFGTNLQVLPIQGWNRSQHLDQTGLPWRNPSPNMRSLTQALLYPGVALVEFCNVSVGRGTDAPFEHLGAPYIHGNLFAQEFNTLGLPGISVLPTTFTPNASKFAGKTCHGLKFHITDRETFRPVDTGLALAWLLHQHYPDELGLDKIDTLLGNTAILELLREGVGLGFILGQLPGNEGRFKKRRKGFLLYPGE